MTEEQQHELECAACPGEGACGGMFTANTMACASEALGLALPLQRLDPRGRPGARGSVPLGRAAACSACSSETSSRATS